MCRLTTKKVPSSNGVDLKTNQNEQHPNLDLTVVVEGGGIARYKREIEYGLLTLSLMYGLVYKMNPPITPAQEFCIYDDEEPPCRRPDLVAYKVTCAFSMTVMGILGVKNWHFNPIFQQLAPSSSSTKIAATPEQRLFSSLKEADLQNVLILCYQIWDLILSLYIPEHRSETIFLIHHVAAICTAFFSLQYQMVGYYSVFYGGCSEFSSIFLVMTDLDEKFPSILEGPYSNYFEIGLLICKVCFALTFTYYRVYGWIKHSVPLWKDTIHVIDTGSAEKYRPGGKSSMFLYSFLFLDVALGLLQLYWFSQIVSAVIDMVN